MLHLALTEELLDNLWHFGCAADITDFYLRGSAQGQESGVVTEAAIGVIKLGPSITCSVVELEHSLATRSHNFALTPDVIDLSRDESVLLAKIVAVTRPSQASYITREQFYALRQAVEARQP